MSKTAEAALGKWVGILSHFGVEDEFLQNRHGPCPFCGGKDRYRFDDKDGKGTFYCSSCGPGNGFDFLMKLKGWNFAEAAKAVDEIVGNVQAKKIKKKRSSAGLIESITNSKRVAWYDVRLYLRHRGLRATQNIFQVKRPYFDHDGTKQGSYECMACPIVSKDGEIESYHITYLNNGKKADVENPKKVLPAINGLGGCAIRLTDNYPEIGIAEGIETALAVMELFKMPCWSVINTSVMEQFEPPEGVERVVIFADNDTNFAGHKAAYTLANKLALKRIAVMVKIPPEGCNDFADALLKERRGKA